jgi:hypothetical protein
MNYKATGAALLDNTVIHGAVAAYHEWPPSPISWRTNPYAVNLRSLMDVIEAIVLFDIIKLDCACGSLADPSSYDSRLDFQREWHPFMELRDLNTGDLIFELEQFSSEADVIGGGIIATAAERLQKHLADGLIKGQADLFRSGRTALAVPEFYTGPNQFAALLRRSFDPEAVFSAYIPHSFRSGILAQDGRLARTTFAQLALDCGSCEMPGKS